MGPGPPACGLPDDSEVARTQSQRGGADEEESKAPRGGDGPSSCRWVFVAVRRSSFFAYWLAIALCVGIGADRAGVFFGLLFSHLVAGFFSSLFPMSTHLAALPCRTSREPPSARKFSAATQEREVLNHPIGSVCIRFHRVGPLSGSSRERLQI